MKKIFKTVFTPAELVNVNRENTFIDDKSIPNETIFYHSKLLIWISIISGISMFVFGVGVISAHLVADNTEEISNNYFLVIFCIFLSFMGISLTYKEYIKLKRREPQLILNNRGIKTSKTSFYNWKEVEDEKFYIGQHWKMTYKHPRGVEEIFQTDLNISAKKLAKLLVLYRERNKLQN